VFNSWAAFNGWAKEQIEKQERNNDLEWKMEGKSERRDVFLVSESFGGGSPLAPEVLQRDSGPKGEFVNSGNFSAPALDQEHEPNDKQNSGDDLHYCAVIHAVPPSLLSAVFPQR